MSETIESKWFGGKVTETKVVDRNGVPVGQISGYIATWGIDRGQFGIRDRFKKGAFLTSIQEHKDRDNRQVRFKDHHGRTVGGFPINTVLEDDVGLFGVAEVNLDVQQGAEVFALAKQGVLVDFSIGFTVQESEMDDDIRLRTIEKATIFEGSIVDEPMNMAAKVTDVKNFDFDKLSKCLNDDCRLEDDQIVEIVASIKNMQEESKPAVDVADVKNIIDLKGLEGLLCSNGFSQDAATLLIKVAHFIKSGRQGELGNGIDDDHGEHGNPDELLLQLKSMNESYLQTHIAHEIKQLGRSVENV